MSVPYEIQTHKIKITSNDFSMCFNHGFEILNTMVVHGELVIITKSPKASEITTVKFHWLRTYALIPADHSYVGTFFHETYGASLHLFWN